MPYSHSWNSAQNKRAILVRISKKTIKAITVASAPLVIYLTYRGTADAALQGQFMCENMWMNIFQGFLFTIYISQPTIFLVSIIIPFTLFIYSAIYVLSNQRPRNRVPAALSASNSKAMGLIHMGTCVLSNANYRTIKWCISSVCVFPENCLLLLACCFG